MDFGLYEMKIVRNNPSSVKSDPRLTRTNDLSPLGSDLSEVYCIYIYIYIYIFCFFFVFCFFPWLQSVVVFSFQQLFTTFHAVSVRVLSNN